MTNNTPPVLGKTVWVLGAGASAHAGIPLLRDFMVKARLLQKGRKDLAGAGAFETVFKWTEELRGAAYYTDLDLDNLEHLFSMAEMLNQTEGGKSPVWNAMRQLVLETIEKSVAFIDDGKGRTSDRVYSVFVQKLRELEKERKTRLSGNSEALERDVVVSFNYDVLLDEALYKFDNPPDYGLGEHTVLQEGARSERGFGLLKLHGSLNWGVCAKEGCEAKVQVIQLSPKLSDGFSNFSVPGRDLHVEFRLVDKLRALKCPTCGDSHTLSPLLIPPTWSKIIERKAMKKVWAEAIRQLKSASQIVVAGYSMPQTDTFFQYLLALGLKANSELHRVVVVDKDCGPGLKERYKKVFSRSLFERGRIVFVESSFENFVEGKAGSPENMDWYGKFLSTPDILGK